MNTLIIVHLKNLINFSVVNLFKQIYKNTLTICLNKFKIQSVKRLQYGEGIAS